MEFQFLVTGTMNSDISTALISYNWINTIPKLMKMYSHIWILTDRYSCSKCFQGLYVWCNLRIESFSLYNEYLLINQKPRRTIFWGVYGGNIYYREPLKDLIIKSDIQSGRKVLLWFREFWNLSNSSWLLEWVVCKVFGVEFNIPMSSYAPAIRFVYWGAVGAKLCSSNNRIILKAA